MMSTVVLIAFSLSIIVFQISCTKEGKAETAPTSEGLKQLGKMIYFKGVNSDLWIANYDGTAKQKINISLPAGLEIDNESVHLSPDGKKILMSLIKETNTGGVWITSRYIYTCDVNGSNLKKIMDDDDVELQGAY